MAVHVFQFALKKLFFDFKNHIKKETRLRLFCRHFLILKKLQYFEDLDTRDRYFFA